jgi:peptidyl-prolyl cis-trans isomerase B (cyclophilin B)
MNMTISGRLISKLVSLVAIALLLFATACNSADNETLADTSQVPGAQSPTPTAGLPQLQGSATVTLQVNGQPIVIEVDGKNAPITAGNFVDLVKRGVYNGTLFHRVVPNFVAQGGDPQSKDPKTPPQLLGQGSFIDPSTKKERYVPLEITPENAAQPIYSKTLATAAVNAPPKLKHTRGAVAMARTPLPDSASAQFYIALNQLDSLNGDYAVFGYVTQGMDVVDKIKQGDRIESATVTKGSENLRN